MKPKPAAITGPSAWRAADLGPKNELAVDLTAAQLGALVDAARRCQRAEIPTEDIRREDFQLGPIEHDVERWRRDVFEGTGFTLLRGLPVSELSLSEIEALYFGLGTHFGHPVSQSNLGERLGHVTDVGGKDRRERAYRNSRELTLHTDRCDVVGMLCVRKARRGGLSGYTSTHTVYNAMLAERPDLLEPLMRGFRYHRFGEQPPGQPQVTRSEVPIFSLANGRLSVVFLRTYIEMAARELGEELTEREVEALDYFEKTARRDDLKLAFMLEPGDIIFFNNCTMVHHRTSFTDGHDPAEKRLLLRLWLMAPEDWPLGEAHATYKGQGIARRDDGSTYYNGNALPEPMDEPVHP